MQGVGGNGVGISCACCIVCHDVIGTTSGVGNHEALIGRVGLIVTKIEVGAARHCIVTDKKLGTSFSGRTVKIEAQRLSCRNIHTVIDRSTMCKRGRIRCAESECFDIHPGGVKRGIEVVNLVGFINLVENIAAHNHVVIATDKAGHCTGCCLSVAFITIKPSVDPYPGKQCVAHIPDGITGEVDAVAPLPGNDLSAFVGDRIADACQRTGNTIFRHSNNTRHQVNRSWLGYLYRRGIHCGIVAFTAALVDGITTVNNTEYIIFAADTIRNAERLVEYDICTSRQCRPALRIPQIDI